jgi:hypothetical protein
MLLQVYLCWVESNEAEGVFCSIMLGQTRFSQLYGTEHCSHLEDVVLTEEGSLI